MELADLLSEPLSDRLKLGTSYTHRIDIIINACSVAVFSGLILQIPEPKQDDVKHQRKQIRHSTTTGSVSDALATPERKRFSEKVQDMAGRGVTIRALLTFTKSLLQKRVMPSFDPWKSTTNDVVRQAIIPLSRSPSGGGCALASVWNREEPVFPVRMVTHNWSNIFLHLVAAVVAEGLGIDMYCDLAEMLASLEGLTDIMARLESKGSLDMSFWICAFSVNQHASICGGFGKAPVGGSRRAWAAYNRSRRDTVTGKKYPTCNCCERKFFNDEPEHCELNKFDDVMRFLRYWHREAFAQVIVVDVSFQVFSRAWCVAEIIEGNNLGIKSSVKILSEIILDTHYDMLTVLDVQECKASRVEDKDMILAKITDTAVFNLHLQECIFGTAGLFHQWRDGQEQARQIGRILRRAWLPENEDRKSLLESESDASSVEGSIISDYSNV